MKLIKEKEPFSKKYKAKTFFLIFGVFVLIGGITGGAEGIKILFPIALVLLAIFALGESLEKKYDGWKLEDDGIYLQRVDLFRGKESIFLLFVDIESIKYFTSQPRQPLAFLFKTKNGKRTLEPRVQIFQFAPLLKLFYEKNIPIRYSVTDHEVDLYIKGQIESLPMTNDMKIKSKSTKNGRAK